MPHYDTLNYYLKKLPPECLFGLRKKMVMILILGKPFDMDRLFRRYWRIILDGTSVFYFKEKHCDNCLCTIRKTNEGKTIKLYYHKVLESKDVTKQDCEINAAKRLLVKIKSISEASPLYSGRRSVRDGTIHESLQGRIPFGISFYAERQQIKETEGRI